MEYPPGWTCERTARALERYVLETLLLSEALALAEHLEACDGCPQQVVLLRLRVSRRSRG